MQARHLSFSVVPGLAAVAAACLAGCVAARPASVPARPAAGPLTEAAALYEAGRFTEALIACVDLARRDPPPAGLPELQARILDRLAYERERDAATRDAASRRRMGLDVVEDRILPDTYGLRRGVEGESGSLKTPRSGMEEALQKRITVHLDGVTLSDFILAIGATENINIVSDETQATATMSIHAEDVPLMEILDYVSRNLGVKFYVGENIVWATAAAGGDSSPPMDTRMYRLRKGSSGKDIEDAQSPEPSLVAAIKRFVPDAEGSDLLYDPRTHLLIVRDTRDRLARVERIIEALDVLPPQVMIEARFISTSLNDLRELGVDWLLQGPLVVSSRSVERDGVRDDNAPRTVIRDAEVTFAGFPNAAQGLNLTYQGLLTDPMFQAVLHALETSGRSRTLSVPKVTTVNNREARIRVGEDFRYFEEYDIESTPSTTADGSTVYRTTLVPVGRPQLEELGIELAVTPSVGADLSSITLLLKPEISEFVRYEFYRVSGDETAGSLTSTNSTDSLVKLPIFRRSTIETEVIVGSGETVVMGGLISSTETDNDTSVPFLSRLPLIGWLFSQKNVEERKQNLLIFVTASILSQRGEQLVPATEVVRP